MIGTNRNKIKSGKLSFEFYDNITDIHYNGVTDIFVSKNLPVFLNREPGELPIARLLHSGEKSAATISCLLPVEKSIAEVKEARRW